MTLLTAAPPPCRLHHPHLRRRARNPAGGPMRAIQYVYLHAYLCHFRCLYFSYCPAWILFHNDCSTSKYYMLPTLRPNHHALSIAFAAADVGAHSEGVGIVMRYEGDHMLRAILYILTPLSSARCMTYCDTLNPLPSTSAPIYIYFCC